MEAITRSIDLLELIEELWGQEAVNIRRFETKAVNFAIGQAMKHPQLRLADPRWIRGWLEKWQREETEHVLFEAIEDRRWKP